MAGAPATLPGEGPIQPGPSSGPPQPGPSSGPPQPGPSGAPPSQPSQPSSGGSQTDAIMPYVAMSMANPQSAMQALMALMAAQQSDAQGQQQMYQGSIIGQGGVIAQRQRAAAMAAAMGANSQYDMLSQALSDAEAAARSAENDRNNKINQMKADMDAANQRALAESAAAAEEARKQTALLEQQAKDTERAGKVGSMYDDMNSYTDANAATASKRRRYASGRKATILTGGLGASGRANVGRKTLLGQ